MNSFETIKVEEPAKKLISIEKPRLSAALRSLSRTSGIIKEPEPLPDNFLPKERIANAKAHVLMYIREFCHHFYPQGRESGKNMYWEVPAPHLIKISFREGNMFKWNDTRKPEGDLVELWKYTTGEKRFRQVIFAMEKWCEQLEAGQLEKPVAENIPQFGPKLLTYVYLLDEGNILTVRGTARSLWKKTLEAIRKKDPELEADGYIPVDLQKSTYYLRKLEMWAGTNDTVCFSVQKKSRKKSTEFIVTVTPKIPEDEVGLISRMNKSAPTK
jgi:hypothetical protein